MNIFTHLRESLANLFSAKLRSFLAILGILVGTGSVVALITTSQLATANALAQFKTLGTHLLAVTISPGSQQQPGSGSQQKQFTVDDVTALKKTSSKIEKIAPYVTTFKTLSYHGKTFNGSVIGSDRRFPQVAKVYLQSGRFVSLLDGINLYCDIGSTLAENLYKQGLFAPIGHQIMLGNWYFTIVGVMKKWKPNLFVFVDLNNSVLVPIRTSYLLSQYAQINNLLMKLSPEANMPYMQKSVKTNIEQIVPNSQVNVRSPEQILKIMAKQQATYTWLLAAIGGISLLVGGIGVMNIMLVSVVERRREIGIRLAIGAHQKDILMMFLTESVLLTIFGGLFGIVVGLVVSYSIAYMSKWGFHFFLLPPVLGFGVSVFVGITSGFYPALRASRLDPIESLHAE